MLLSNKIGNELNLPYRNWNCPENANKELVKSMKEMGIRIGQLKAENECLKNSSAGTSSAKFHLQHFLIMVEL